ncbi:hypothetical protein K4F52_010330 [Lecanicillium sp. MT-2017a]|nr:hypothetical protein K4F52_010330 [Lecanicillium sp. MT-2017a]
MEQLPPDAFEEADGDASVDLQRKLQVRLAEQQMLNYFRLDAMKVSRDESSGFLAEPSAPTPWPSSTAIHIQHHSLFCCEQMKNVLTAEDEHGTSPSAKTTIELGDPLSEVNIPDNWYEGNSREGRGVFRFLKYTENDEPPRKRPRSEV